MGDPGLLLGTPKQQYAGQLGRQDPYLEEWRYRIIQHQDTQDVVEHLRRPHSETIYRRSSAQFLPKPEQVDFRVQDTPVSQGDTLQIQRDCKRNASASSLISCIPTASLISKASPACVPPPHCPSPPYQPSLAETAQTNESKPEPYTSTASSRVIPLTRQCCSFAPLQPLTTSLSQQVYLYPNRLA